VKEFTYFVDMPNELCAGLCGFTDEIKITVESGDPGGEADGEDSFKEFMLNALKEWYAGASISIVERDI